MVWFIASAYFMLINIATACTYAAYFGASRTAFRGWPNTLFTDVARVLRRALRLPQPTAKKEENLIIRKQSTSVCANSLALFGRILECCSACPGMRTYASGLFVVVT